MKRKEKAKEKIVRIQLKKQLIEPSKTYIVSEYEALV